jgi:LuxR family maltose regulon positive regulatory protein
MHLLIATRADPPLPLTRLRARGQLHELRATDLRFSLEETSTFLQTIMGLDLPSQTLEALEQHTEGWIAGLQLAAHSLYGRTDISAILTAFTGSNRFVLDYLTDEVLARQPVEVQTFLFHTSILERLSGSLCDSVIGQEGSQTMLEALEHASLFLVSLDDERHWYRYHHLFAQALHSRLLQSQPALVTDLHRRASGWYEQQNLPCEAIRHALAAPDIELAARLIEQFGLKLTTDGRIYEVLGWLDMLPDMLMRTSPLLCTYHAILLRTVNRLQEAQAPLDMAEACIKRDQEKMPADQLRTMMGRITLGRAQTALFRGEITAALADAYKALDLVPETDLIAHPSAMLTVAHGYFVSGDMTAATQRLAEATAAVTHATRNPLADLRGVTLLARLYMLQGKLREAAATYKQALRTVPKPKVLQGLGMGSLFYFFSLAELYYERNALDEASYCLTQGMAMIGERLTVEPFVAIVGYTTLARLRQARGDSSGALTALDAFTRLADARHFAPQWRASMAAVRAQLELAQGHLASAVAWADTCGLSTSDNDLSYSREQEYLTLARVRIAQGQHDPAASCVQDTLHLLDRLLKDAEAKARMNSVLHIRVLRALALATQRNRKEALTTLKQVLLMAEPEGYIRLFVDAGAAMRTLLRLAQAQGIVPDYIATLLSAFDEQKTVPSAQSASFESLVEPLTKREMEVLRLLAVGHSNAAIAQDLVIAIGTVKRHVNSIYSKLGVGSRTQAIARAHALHLI